MLQSKKDKGTAYVLSVKLKGVYTSKLKPLYITFLHTINLSGYRMGIKFDKNPLAVEQSNCATNVVKTYIVCDLDDRPRNPNNNFKLKNCLFSATNIVKNSDQKICV